MRGERRLRCEQRSPMSQEEARIKLANHPAGNRMESYLCEFCGHWHLQPRRDDAR